MVEEAGTEWGILKAELEKLKLFVKGKKAAGLEDALACLGYRKESNPFDFPRAIQTRQAKTCMSLLRRQLEEDAEPFGLLRGITNTLNKQLKAKRLVKAGVAAEQIFRELRLQSYYDRDFLTQLARISEDRLIRDLGECVAAEVALKSKSWLDPAAELSLLVGRICTPTARK
jgi:DNA polymerase-3 subunit delta